MCFHEVDSCQIVLHILMGLIMIEIRSMTMGVIMNMPMNIIRVVILSLVVILVPVMRVDVMRVVHLMSVFLSYCRLPWIVNTIRFIIYKCTALLSNVGSHFTYGRLPFFHKPRIVYKDSTLNLQVRFKCWSFLFSQTMRLISIFYVVSTTYVFVVWGRSKLVNSWQSIIHVIVSVVVMTIFEHGRSLLLKTAIPLQMCTTTRSVFERFVNVDVCLWQHSPFLVDIICVANSVLLFLI